MFIDFPRVLFSGRSTALIPSKRQGMNDPFPTTKNLLFQFAIEIRFINFPSINTLHTAILYNEISKTNMGYITYLSLNVIQNLVHLHTEHFPL